MVALHVTHWGHAGEKIILVHGGVQGSKRGGADHFPTQKALVDDGFHVLVPDRPGHGQSAFPGRPDDPEADGELIAEMLGEGAPGCAEAIVLRRDTRPALREVDSHSIHTRLVARGD